MKTTLNEKSKTINQFLNYEIQRTSQITVYGGEVTETAKADEEIE
mgnify:CR=1 FL=1